MIVFENDLQAVDKAIELLKKGSVISFACDTIYGVACDASNYKAVEALYQLKKRDLKKPIAIFLPNFSKAEKFFILDETAKKIAKKYLPGALTIVAKVSEEAKKNLANNLNYGDNNFIGFRIVDSFFVKKLFEKFDGILAVTSANISAQDPAQNAQEVAQYFPELELIVAGELKYKQASTVIKIVDEKIELIRNGALKINELES